MIEKNEILSRAIHECLCDMYKFSQPYLDFNEYYHKIVNKEINAEDFWYKKYYLSEENYKLIEEHYLYIYNLKSNWKDFSQLCIDFLKNGGNKTTFKKDSFNISQKIYVKTPKLEDEIGAENSKKVFNLLQDCQDFYKLNSDENTFRFTVMNFSPNSNKEEVVKYWKNKTGEDLIIKNISENEIFGLEDDE